MNRKTRWLLLTSLFLSTAAALFWWQENGRLRFLTTSESGLGRRNPAAEGDAILAAPPKVELDPSLLIPSRLQPSHPGGNALRPSHAPMAIPRGRRLVAVVDNDCLDQDASESSPSALAYQTSEADAIDGLRFQAYAFTTEADIDVDELLAQANADSCLRHLTSDRNLTFKLPRPKVESLKVSSLTPAATNDPQISQQAHLSALNLSAASEVLFNSGRPLTDDVIVAVVDSGVDYTHPDLAANMWHDSAGKVGYDFIHNDADPMDDLNHGTHVAGLIGAAADNGIGVSGVIGKHVKIMAVKVISNKDEGTLSGLVNGIRYAADHGADVINLSLGGSDPATAESDAIRYAIAKGSVVVVAAGNDGIELTSSKNEYPAGYAPDLPGLITAGSVDSSSGGRSSFSNYSTKYVYIGAPGAESSSSQRGLLSTLPSTSYGRMEGTSMSAPVLSGAAALVVSAMKGAGVARSPATVTDVLMESAQPDASLSGSFKSGGRLDLLRLSKILKSRYMVTGDAGTEDSQ